MRRMVQIETSGNVHNMLRAIQIHQRTNTAIRKRAQVGCCDAPARAGPQQLSLVVRSDQAGAGFCKQTRRASRAVY